MIRTWFNIVFSVPNAFCFCEIVLLSIFFLDNFSHGLKGTTAIPEIICKPEKILFRRGVYPLMNKESQSQEYSQYCILPLNYIAQTVAYTLAYFFFSLSSGTGPHDWSRTIVIPPLSWGLGYTYPESTEVWKSEKIWILLTRKRSKNSLMINQNYLQYLHIQEAERLVKGKIEMLYYVIKFRRGKKMENK